jgi:flagellar motor switch protein FliG
MAKIVPLDLKSRKKAAVLLMLLGPELASQVIKFLDETQVEAIALELARLNKVTPEQRSATIQEFHEMAIAQDFISEGGLDQARKVLISAYGEEKAEEILKKIIQEMQSVPFDFLKRADPSQLVSFLQDEHPQTIALILAYLPVSQAATILTKLPAELRGEVAERIAMMDQSPPEVIREVEGVLEQRVASVISQEMTQVGGPKALVDLLNRVDRGSERLILESLSQSNPELASTVKNMMFVFEDIAHLDDRAIQQILKETDTKDLATALKNTTEEVTEKIFKNMSERAKNMLTEDMEYMGSVKLKVVEEAQQKIVATIRRLEETGEIDISRGEEDVMVE